MKIKLSSVLLITFLILTTQLNAKEKKKENGIRFGISSGAGASIALNKYNITGFIPFISHIAITHNMLSFGVEHKFNPYKPTYLTYKYAKEVSAKTKFGEQYIGGFFDIQPGNKTKFVLHLGVGVSLFSKRYITTPDNQIIETLPYKTFVSGNIGIGMRHNFVNNFGIELMAKTYVSNQKLIQYDFEIENYILFQNVLSLGFYIPISFKKGSNSTSY